MSFWSTLAALFVRDTVKSIDDAKKAEQRERQESQKLVQQWQAQDNALYRQYAPACLQSAGQAEKKLDEICEREFDSIGFGSGELNKMKRAMFAYPYYAVLEGQGGATNDVQKRFISVLKATGSSFSGDDIVASANGNSQIKEDIVENGALSDTVGAAWVKLLSIPSSDDEKLRSDLREIAVCLADVAKNFAKMADVIVEDELHDEMIAAYDSIAQSITVKSAPEYTTEKLMVATRRHAEKLYQVINRYSAAAGIQAPLFRGLMEFCIMGIAYTNVSKYRDRFADSNDGPNRALLQVQVFAELSGLEKGRNYFETLNANPDLDLVKNAYPIKGKTSVWAWIILDDTSEYLPFASQILTELYGVIWAWAMGVEKSLNVAGFGEFATKEFYENVLNRLTK